MTTSAPHPPPHPQPKRRENLIGGRRRRNRKEDSFDDVHIPASKPSSPHSCADGGIEEFEAMMELMQQKFKRKSQDQLKRHQIQMEATIKKTLKSLNEQTCVFENKLYFTNFYLIIRNLRLSSLREELEKIDKEKELELKSYKKHYHTIRDEMDTIINKIDYLNSKSTKLYTLFLNEMEATSQEVKESLLGTIISNNK